MVLDIICYKKHPVQFWIHWGRVTHICVSKLTIIGLDNGLSPGRRQAIISTNAGILLIGALGTNVSEILIKNCTFSLTKMLLKMSSRKRRPSCPGLNVLSRVMMLWMKSPSAELFTFHRRHSQVAASYWIKTWHLRRLFVWSKMICLQMSFI